VGGEKSIRKGYRRVNEVEILYTMYENGKVRPVESSPRMGEGVKENHGGGEFN
jgi:hypothetical protein